MPHGRGSGTGPGARARGGRPSGPRGEWRMEDEGGASAAGQRPCPGGAGASGRGRRGLRRRARGAEAPQRDRLPRRGAQSAGRAGTIGKDGSARAGGRSRWTSGAGLDAALASLERRRALDDGQGGGAAGQVEARGGYRQPRRPVRPGSRQGEKAERKAERGHHAQPAQDQPVIAMAPVDHPGKIGGAAIPRKGRRGAPGNNPFPGPSRMAVPASSRPALPARPPLPVGPAYRKRQIDAA
ncbi:hypothetical protein SAMN05444417_3362 [Wenxinia saemankumensis]|uniref:Uncharacterized protein n=1 Tax=Wenxinia saemankumensis TaxID=1447782 RepID=A0A1M6HU60_9RHOB|nr:hypothetical protein SAMN05444417_3362 [Wenxinia saemankumensis]